MQLQFLGAARSVTGSCHLLRVGGRTVLLDCGQIQGTRLRSRYGADVRMPSRGEVVELRAARAR